ncbi:hypothetical protein JCM21531_4682 [Acetivibrio straminisolvens JCM 21531]|uniref:Uncharacterized protein n=1 Tax=Acetivibrio straminisolvens JCM 21531 TaxID=1294263 RepID=W4VDY5_9FIRM|nr:hypothetical protein JCM21531_4682 [Acetivibrio straminisolvens JCM 21531]
MNGFSSGKYNSSPFTTTRSGILIAKVIFEKSIVTINIVNINFADFLILSPPFYYSLY